MSEVPWSDRRLHFIGIGGAGMSGLALVAHELGAQVTGSDRAASTYLERIEAAGIKVSHEHQAGDLPDGVEVVVSTAIDEANPELVQARADGSPVLHRADLLADFCRGHKVVAVAGTHGKTTTTAMVVWALSSLGLDPSFFLGGEVASRGNPDIRVNSAWTGSELIVVEADESDGSFLKLTPEVAVILNVEMDHHAQWASLAELRAAFAEFARSSRQVVLPAEGGAELEHGEEVQTSWFSIDAPGPERIELSQPGRHNLLDARAALAAIHALGLDPDEAAAGLVDFPGVGRRLEFRGSRDGVLVYDDYAHHPTEVRASLQALRDLDPERLVAVFQPHLYSRTKAFSQAFGAALSEADEIVVLDVYPAREEPIGELEGVSGLDILRATAERSGGRPTWWAPTLDAAERAVKRIASPGTTVVTIGAGDITLLAGRLSGNGESHDG